MRTTEQKAAHAAYMRMWYAENPGYKSAADRKHREKHRDKLIAYDRERAKRPERIASKQAADSAYRKLHSEENKVYFRNYYKEHKERWVGYNNTPERKTYMTTYLRQYGLRQKYGITEADYNNMFDRQGGICAICKQPPKGRSLHVDHDHVTGRIRGLLCTRCNNALERLEKYPGWSRRAEEYLRCTSMPPKAVGA